MASWVSRLSLRARITVIAVGITVVAVLAVAAAGILQMRDRITVDEHRSADSLALGFVRASELAITVGDKPELTRLAGSFIRDDNVLFAAAYGGSDKPLAVAVRDRSAWQEFVAGKNDDTQCILSEQPVISAETPDEFTGDATPDAAPANVHAPKQVGRVVVGVSTAAARLAMARQTRLSVEATLLAVGIGSLVLFLTLGSSMRRLGRLAQASRAISAGDLSSAIEDHRDDEIGRLSTAFDDMRKALAARDQDLRRFTDTLQDQVRERTADLQSALTQAQEANRAKSLFLANMSHELRTPLNGVIGMVDLLLSASPNLQQRRYCDIAKSSARSLVELINDILDFSKIEAGKLDLDQTDFNLHEVVEGVTQILAERAQKKGIELLCSVDAPVPRIVGGDPTRLRQVLLNLASNAVKFTEKGDVIVDAHVESSTAEETVVKFTVTDSGIGIPADRLDRLFKSFSQVDASTTRKFGGTGLGLAISQRIVEMMGGQIGVTSTEGKGSVFWFTARLAVRSQAVILRKEAGVDPRGLRVLAVDDNQTNREILQAQLRSWSLRADVAVSAEQAMGMLTTASESGDPYRFAILDMHMPHVDGMQLASRIHAEPRTRGVILISLSSISDQIKKEQMDQHGITACLTKPVLPSQLYDTIVNSLAVTMQDQPPIPAVKPQPTRLDGVRILLAEDNEVNQMVATELLQLVGATVTSAVNGQEAFDLAMKDEHDIILMDCQMPVLDGFEATRRIRLEESRQGDGKHRSIIALTANAIKGDRELCLGSGMDEYLTKPLEPADLLRIITQLLPAGFQIKPAPASLQEPGQPAAMPSPKATPVDLPSLQRRCLNNRKLAAKALKLFDTAIDVDLKAITASITEGNAPGIAAAAHKLKGAAANVSAEPIRKISAELEKLGRESAVSQCETALEAIRGEVDSFRAYLSTALGELIPPTGESGK